MYNARHALAHRRYPAIHFSNLGSFGGSREQTKPPFVCPKRHYYQVPTTCIKRTSALPRGDKPKAPATAPAVPNFLNIVEADFDRHDSSWPFAAALAEASIPSRPTYPLGLGALMVNHGIGIVRLKIHPASMDTFWITQNFQLNSTP